MAEIAVSIADLRSMDDMFFARMTPATNMANPIFAWRSNA